jgi:sulfur-oxidizing protein SoxA
MKKLLIGGLAMALAATAGAGAASTSPEDDLKQFRDYFANRFEGTPFPDFVNGVYSIDEPSRAQWESIEEFPPYEIAVEEGEELFNAPFKNGKSYADCFPGWEDGIRQNYPYFDTKTNQVKTLEQEINECRVNNGEEPLPWKKGKIASLSAFLAYKSRGKTIDVKVPNDEAMKWYERGKRHFYAKRGQLNLACANCHIDSAGMMIRADKLSPALGHPSHFPVYRSKWGNMGTLHRRYAGCNKQVRAKPFKAQSDEYRALEYFHTYMSNGLAVNGPGARK